MNNIFETTLSLVNNQLLKFGIEQFSFLNDIPNYLGGERTKNKKFIYTENKRLNFNFGKYPPCFNLNHEAQQIYETLDMKGLVIKHQRLFDIYSILLCQKYHASYKECNSKMIDDRINDVKKMMPKSFNKKKYKEKISKYLKLNKNRISKLILICYYLIEKEINAINDDKIRELNHRFYFSTFKELYMLCEGY